MPAPHHPAVAARPPSNPFELGFQARFVEALSDASTSEGVPAAPSPRPRARVARRALARGARSFAPCACPRSTATCRALRATRWLNRATVPASTTPPTIGGARPGAARARLPSPYPPTELFRSSPRRLKTARTRGRACACAKASALPSSSRRTRRSTARCRRGARRARRELDTRARARGVPARRAACRGPSRPRASRRSSSRRSRSRRRPRRRCPGRPRAQDRAAAAPPAAATAGAGGAALSTAATFGRAAAAPPPPLRRPRPRRPPPLPPQAATAPPRPPLPPSAAAALPAAASASRDGAALPAAACEPRRRRPARHFFRRARRPCLRCVTRCSTPRAITLGRGRGATTPAWMTAQYGR